MTKLGIPHSLNYTTCRHAHRIHVWYSHLHLVFKVNVDEYTDTIHGSYGMIWKPTSTCILPAPPPTHANHQHPQTDTVRSRKNITWYDFLRSDLIYIPASSKGFCLDPRDGVWSIIHSAPFGRSRYVHRKQLFWGGW